MDLSKYDWSSVLSSVGNVATVFNPVLGRGLVVASEVVEKFESNDILENNIIGLIRCSEIIDNIVINKNFDIEQLSLVSHSLKSLALVVDKTSKILR